MRRFGEDVFDPVLLPSLDAGVETEKRLRSVLEEDRLVLAKPLLAIEANVVFQIHIVSEIAQARRQVVLLGMKGRCAGAKAAGRCIDTFRVAFPGPRRPDRKGAILYSRRQIPRHPARLPDRLRGLHPLL